MISQSFLLPGTGGCNVSLLHASLHISSVRIMQEDASRAVLKLQIT